VEALLAILQKWQLYHHLSRAEFIFLAQYAQVGCEELTGDPATPRSESLACMIEVLLAVRTLRVDGGIELDRYYLGNLGAVGAPLLTQPQIDPDAVPKAGTPNSLLEPLGGPANCVLRPKLRHRRGPNHRTARASVRSVRSRENGRIEQTLSFRTIRGAGDNIGRLGQQLRIDLHGGETDCRRNVRSSSRLMINCDTEGFQAVICSSLPAKISRVFHLAFVCYVLCRNSAYSLCVAR
jgi:hypothetical protein